MRHSPRILTEPLALGLGALLMLSYERRSALTNLARAYPAWSRLRRWRVGFAAYRQMARALVEFLHTRDYSDREILDRVMIENPEALAAAHAEGRGVLLLSGHYGNWEWLGRRIVAAGYPFAVLYKEPKDVGLGERLRETRVAAGLVQIDHDDMRGAIQWLRRGGVLGIIMDQEPRRTRDGALAPLFGQPTMTHVGPFRLARLTGSPMMTIFCRRVGRGRYRGRLESVTPSESSDPELAGAEDAAAFNARLEAAVRRAPDHWLWMYPRWKRLARRGEREETAAGPSLP
ncbi:MAG TPA: lysophospholipid acyltransferase family protein [Gemmatimonadota bacterium]|nr:lysophospholipid acyltransferase family protein [Gemmatimonadota bacterium]